MAQGGSKPSLLRAINLRATFMAIHEGGPAAAARIVEVTGLSKPTVSGVLNQLLDARLIRKVGRTAGQVGPTAQLYDVDPRAGHVLALDVGHDWVRVAVANLRGEIVGCTEERTEVGAAHQVVEQLGDLVRALLAKLDVEPDEVMQAVVGTPGVIRPGDDHLSLAPNLPGWERPEVLADLRALLGVPVAFENDVNLAAIGEQATGAGQDVDDFVLIAIGTGVGMAVVLGGALHRGASGLAGEIGYLPLSFDGPITRAEGMAWQEGTFEQSVSSAAVTALAQEAGVENASTAAAVFDAARSGDRAAAGVVATIADRLAHGVAAVAAVLDPELVVLGGGIGTGAGELIVEPMTERLQRLSPLRPRVAISQLGSGAVLHGAVAEGVRLGFERIFGDGAGGLGTGRTGAADGPQP